MKQGNTHTQRGTSAVLGKHINTHPRPLTLQHFWLTGAHPQGHVATLGVAVIQHKALIYQHHPPLSALSFVLVQQSYSCALTLFACMTHLEVFSALPMLVFSWHEKMKKTSPSVKNQSHHCTFPTHRLSFCQWAS